MNPEAWVRYYEEVGSHLGLEALKGGKAQGKGQKGKGKSSMYDGHCYDCCR